MILASHLHMPSYFLKTFTEYLVVWVFVQAQKARSLRCQAY